MGLPFFPSPVIWEDGRVSNEKGQGAGFQMRGLETKSLPRHNGRGPDRKGTRYSFIHRHSLTGSHSIENLIGPVGHITFCLFDIVPLIYGPRIQRRACSRHG